MRRASYRAPTSPLQPVWQQLEGFGTLPPDWDSYGGDPPTRIALQKARRLIADVYDRAAKNAGGSAIPYFVAPGPDGSLQIEWRGSSNTIEVEIGPVGAFGFLRIAQDNDGRQFTKGRNILRSEALTEILDVLTR